MDNRFAESRCVTSSLWCHDWMSSPQFFLWRNFILFPVDSFLKSWFSPFRCWCCITEAMTIFNIRFNLKKKKKEQLSINRIGWLWWMLCVISRLSQHSLGIKRKLYKHFKNWIYFEQLLLNIYLKTFPEACLYIWLTHTASSTAPRAPWTSNTEIKSDMTSGSSILFRFYLFLSRRPCPHICC